MSILLVVVENFMGVRRLWVAIVLQGTLTVK